MERDWAYDFDSHQIVGNDLKDCQDVRDEFKKIATKLQELLPNGRYKALVHTKLEEAAMLATKAYSHR